MPRNAAPVRPSLALSLQRTLLIICAIVLTTAGEASADDDNEVQAAKHYEQGKAFFRVGEYALCAAEFRSSYKLVNKPGALFNEARCHEEQGEYNAAVESFDGYIAAEPDGAQVAEATARATALRRKLKEAEAVPASPESTEETPEVTPEVTPEEESVTEASPPDTDAPTGASTTTGSQEPHLDTTIAPRPSSKSNTRRVIAISTGAAGIVGLGVATAFAIGARSDWQEAQELCAGGSPCSSIEGVGLSKEAKSSAQLATVLVGISTVSLAAATYFWLSQPTERNMAVSVAPAATGKGGSIHLGMNF